MNREVHVRFCESLKGKFLRATRPQTINLRSFILGYFESLRVERYIPNRLPVSRTA
jgi:hypothetical protein